MAKLKPADVAAPAPEVRLLTPTLHNATREEILDPARPPLPSRPRLTFRWVASNATVGRVEGSVFAATEAEALDQVRAWLTTNISIGTGV